MTTRKTAIKSNSRELILMMEEENRTVNRMGDYSVTKYYDVLNPDRTLATDINGWVVQIVEKSSRASVNTTRPRILDTTKKIMDFTSNQVNNMCEAYIERFEIINGTSEDGDAFANGAVSKYGMNDKGEMIPIVNRHEDAFLQTSGEIVQRGINYLFVDPQKIADIERLPWIQVEDDQNDPSNGLSHISITKRSAIERIPSDSVNRPVHTVVATWELDNPLTNLNITMDNEGLKGGGLRNTRKNRQK